MVALLCLCWRGSKSVAQPDAADSVPPASAEEASADPTAWASELIGSGHAEPLAEELQGERDWGRFSTLVSLLHERDETALLADTLVLDALLARLDEAPNAIKQQILPLVQTDFRRDAIRRVILLLDHEEPEIRSLAMQTLIIQTGREDLGDDPAAWRQWWSEHEWIPEIEWLRRVALWQTHRAQKMVASSQDAKLQLIETLRELYSATAVEKRPALLIRLLQHPAADARRLGLELASRSILNATPLSEATLDAAIELLSDSDADLRMGAARLFGAVTLADQHQSLSSALAAEKEPGVASVFFVALGSVDPSRTDVAAAVKWIDNPITRASAVHVLLSAADSGKLDAPSERNAAWRVVFEDAGVSMGPTGVRLFGRIAPSTDLERLFDLLESPNPVIRDSAGKAISDRQGGLDQLMDAAKNDSSLTSIALETLSQRNATAVGWNRGRALLDPLEKDLKSFASSLPPREALSAAGSEPNERNRLFLLDRFKTFEADEFALSRSELTTAVLLRLHTLLDLSLYEDVLQAVRPPDWLAEDPRYISAGQVAKLALGRFDEVEKAGAGADTWFEALDRLMKEKSTLSAAASRRFRQMWYDDLSDSDRHRLTEVEKKLGMDTLAMPEKKEIDQKKQKKG